MGLLRKRWITPLVLLALLIGLRAVVRRGHHGVSTFIGVIHSVSPTEADPGVTGPDTPTIALTGRSSHFNGLLLVFLPGTGGKPGCCTTFLQRAAALGYHAIGLTYNNETAVATRCVNDLSCFGKLRSNLFDGSEPSALSDLPARDGISHRLASLLAYLAARYPREGWARFVHGGEPDWSAVVMSGHSQGGGEAAFIGTLRNLRGVVALSSPPDTNLSDQAATWLASVPMGRTPLVRIVAFVHDSDPFYARILADWKAMGLGSLGPPASVDGVGGHYRHSHELVSSAPLPQVILAAHNSTAVDSATPTCSDGVARYSPVWDYMLQVAGGLTVGRISAACGR